MYTLQYKPVNKASSALVLGYLAISATVPFLLSYRETNGNNYAAMKGTISLRSLFNKI